MTFKFFTAQSSIGVASHIALEESGLAYELHELEFAKKQQASDEYLKINPKARVPSLVTRQGVITETPAILNYLAQCAPDSAIGLPEDAYQNAQIQSFNSYLCSTVHVAHAHKMRGTRWVDDEAALKAMTDNVPKTMSRCIEMIEQQMLRGPWVHGQLFSISDPYLYRMSTWLESDGVDIKLFPKVNAHRALMAQRDSVKAVEGYFES